MLLNCEGEKPSLNRTVGLMTIRGSDWMDPTMWDCGTPTNRMPARVELQGLSFTCTFLCLVQCRIVNASNDQHSQTTAAQHFCITVRAWPSLLQLQSSCQATFRHVQYMAVHALVSNRGIFHCTAHFLVLFPSHHFASNFSCFLVLVLN